MIVRALTLNLNGTYSLCLNDAIQRLGIRGLRLKKKWSRNLGLVFKWRARSDGQRSCPKKEQQ